MDLVCPVCGCALSKEPLRYICKKGHSFDRAKSGYVNLLMRQRHRLRGDDSAMAQARKTFLDAGYYQPLLNMVLAELPHQKSLDILDVGCGEGWYSCSVVASLLEQGSTVHLCGIDISPQILRFAASRARQQEISDATDWAVASVSHLPVPDCSCDCILNLFAPCEPTAFRRVIKKNGLLIRVVPLEKHLWALKEAVYDQPYENRPVLEAPEGFVLKKLLKLEQTITVPSEHLKALFAMTPYVHKTSPQDIAKLDALDSLTTEIAFGILCFTPAPADN